METYKEIRDDARTILGMLGTHKALTESLELSLISEAVHKIQQKTGVVRREKDVLTSALGSDGSVTIDQDISIVSFCVFTSTGATSGRKVKIADREYLFSLANDDQQVIRSYDPGSCELWMAIDMGKLWFYPFSGLSGTFTLTYTPNLTRYSASRAALVSGDWAGWTGATLTSNMATLSPPREMDGAEEEIIGYVAAKMIEHVPEWEDDKRMVRKHDALLTAFNVKAEELVKANDPPRRINTPTKTSWLGA